jgi:lysophospholipid acyltransferase (LPLAT)-like uncharacterized protein
VLWPLGWLLRAWGRSLRFELSDNTRRNLARFEEPVAFVLWHNRLFLAAEIFRRFRQRRPVHGLVSTSKDGAWLAAFFELAGLRTVRGSSSRGGMEAARALVQVLRAGHDVGITPDGPRGPRYEFKGGALVVARRAGAAVLLVGGAFETAWRLPSWDGFCVPRPFSRVRIECEYVSPAELAETSIAALTARLEAISSDCVDSDKPSSSV